LIFKDVEEKYHSGIIPVLKARPLGFNENIDKLIM
jgi:hypothetical protein